MSAPLPAFERTLRDHGLTLTRPRIRVLQVNVGKKCNQACHHCHVDAGPKRTEVMTPATVDRVLALLAAAPGVEVVDITGGAPELNPDFRRLATGARALGKQVIDRCNLTILSEPGQEDLAGFLAANQIEVVASLPCYTKDNVEKQRGGGVFDRSIAGLRALNALGYGQPGSGLALHLVYNPLGPYLPGPQAALEQDYKQHLGDEWGVVFNHLYTITNMPISRFAHMLERDGKMEDYMQLLLQSFNPAAVAGVMCAELVSIGWDGQIFDCDFNQMLEIPVGWKKRSIFDIRSLENIGPGIALGNHCYGCTAGAGSSCGGALT